MFATIKSFIPEPRQLHQPRAYIGRHRVPETEAEHQTRSKGETGTAPETATTVETATAARPAAGASKLRVA